MIADFVERVATSTPLTLSNEDISNAEEEDIVFFKIVEASKKDINAKLGEFYSKIYFFTFVIL